MKRLGIIGIICLSILIIAGLSGLIYAISRRPLLNSINNDPIVENNLQDIIIEPPYYEIVNKKLISSDISILQVYRFSYSQRLSHSLIEIRFETIELFIELCKNQNISQIFYFRGRMFGEGLLRHFDNWFFLENDILYYFKYQYYFGP